MATADLALHRRAPVVRARSSHRRAVRLLVAWLLGAFAAANGAYLVYLWLHGGGIADVHSTGALYTSIGRITGLLGAYSALIQVLLLARLPWLERAVGFDRLTRWHGLNGKICLLLVLAHTFLITIGYAATDHYSVGKEVSVLLNGYPGMITATVGTALLVAVAASSIVLVRRRLRYEAWYFVHLSAYAAIALAWVHQIPTGNEFVTDHRATAYWNGNYIATLGLLLVFRFAQPAVQSFRYRLRVAEVSAEAPGVVSLLISGRGLERMDVQPGQFFLWRFLSRKGRWWESHPFSLSAAAADDAVRITVKSVGDFTSRIGEIEPGTRVVAEGPFGVFTGDVRKRERVALIAGGIGITPIRALLDELEGDVTLVYRAVREEDLVFTQELDALAAIKGVDVHYVVGDHATEEGKSLLTSDHLRELIPDIAEREVFVCGPPALAQLIQKRVRTAGVPRKFVHVERFAL
jgi:predicted ferric reductase